MGKVIMFNFMTVDGFFEGKNKELNWFNLSEEFHQFANEQLAAAGTLLFGRITYQMMESHWTTATSEVNNLTTISLMNSISKIVFSKTMDKANWNNTKLINKDIEQEITKLKQQAGNDLMILGSANLTSTLRKMNLIDEYRIMVAPVILGKGSPLFKPEVGQLNLNLLKSRTFQSGNVLLYYGVKN